MAFRNNCQDALPVSIIRIMTRLYNNLQVAFCTYTFLQNGLNLSPIHLIPPPTQTER